MNGLVSLPVARATFRERAASPILLALAAIFALVSLRGGLAAKAAGGAFSGLSQALPIVATLVVATALISDELESGHAALALLRPLTRAEWFGGRFAGGAAALAALCALGWVFDGAGALLAQGSLDFAFLLELPLAIVWCASWLAILAALSVVVPRWHNGPALLLAVLGLMLASSLLAGRLPALRPQLQQLDHFIGPASPMDLVLAVRHSARKELEPLLLDLAWLTLGWLTGVLLLNRRELARRRP